MLQRVMPDLMGMKNILVLNDEAHHCYREKPDADDDEELKGDDKKEAEKKQRGGAPLDLRSGSRESSPRSGTRNRLVRDPILSERIRLCRRHVVSMDHE